MEYLYAVLLLHKLGKEVNEENLKKVVAAAGVEVDEAKIKTLVASLKGVDIAKELETASIAAVAPAGAGKPEEKKEEKKEEKAAESVAGLSALFG